MVNPLSSSGDGEDHMLAYRAQWAKETELRELRDKVGKMENAKDGYSLNIVCLLRNEGFPSFRLCASLFL